MQNSADLAAISGAVAIKANFSQTSTTRNSRAYNEAYGVSAAHGFANGTNSVTVTPSIPPTTGSYTTNAYAIEVTVTKPATLLFASLFLNSTPTISTRAVAMLSYSHSDCMVALSAHQDMAFQVIGSSSLTVDCSIAVNSDNAGSNGNGQRNNALYLQGGNGVVLRAYDVNVVGSWGGPGNATVSAQDAFNYSNTNNAVADPYSSFSIPTDCGCGTSISSSGVGTGLTGGANISGDLNISSNVTLSSGIYVVNGNINIVSGGNLVTNGATIILNSTSTTNYTFSMQSANANAILVAPNSTSNLSTKGFALMQSRNAPTDVVDQNGNCTINCSVFQGGPTTKITGAAYLPKGNLSYQGTPGTTQGCTQLIADTFQYQGNPLYTNSCDGVGLTLFGPSTVSMVE